jgi:DNA-binding MarR family transcriptional regulator
VKKQDQIKVVQDYMNFLGKVYIILLSSLDDFADKSLSTNEKVVLQILDETALSMKDISQRTGLALSTLTNIIDKMEKKKLVKRRHSRRDRRMVKIELAASGRRIKARFNELIKSISSSFLEMLSEEDKRNFSTALEKVTQVMSVDTIGDQEAVASLAEPIQVTMDSHFKNQ